MPRQARLILDNVCYHILTRGNQKQIVFVDEKDNNKYMNILIKYKKRYKFKLYGWCLMNNHVHLVIESDKLAKLMHGINLSYALYFKRKYNVVGHFWQDRYKSFIITKDKYLINCINYIEHNPIRANIVSKPDAYLWSSYRVRILGKTNEVLDPIIF